jgi:hypothetical protein
MSSNAQKRKRAKAPKGTRYEYKGKLYKFIAVCKMRIGTIWVMAIMYQSYEDNRMYVREKGEWEEKFKKVIDEINSPNQ